MNSAIVYEKSQLLSSRGSFFRFSMQYAPYRGFAQVIKWDRLNSAALNLKSWRSASERSGVSRHYMLYIFSICSATEFHE